MPFTGNQRLIRYWHTDRLVDDESAVELAMREQQRQRTRASILRVAAEEFDERGYAAVALSEIAKRIELTKGSVYFHFNSKSDLAKAVIDTYFSAWESLVQAISDRELTGLTALRWLSAEVARRYRDDAGVRAPLRLMREANLVGIDLPTPFLAWVESVAKHLGEARHGGRFAPIWISTPSRGRSLPASSVPRKYPTSSLGAPISSSELKRCGKCFCPGSRQYARAKSYLTPSQNRTSHRVRTW